MTVVRRDVKFDEEKAMWCSPEIELQIPQEEDSFTPKKESQEVVEKQQIEEKRVEKTTQEESSREEIKPSPFEETIEKLVWVDAMVEKYESIVKNNVWEVVPRPTDKSIVGSRWIFKVKRATYKRIEEYKAIFVAKGYSQVEGIEYEETFEMNS
eukprot:PITA_07953